MSGGGAWRVSVRAGDPCTVEEWTEAVAKAHAVPALHGSKHARTHRGRVGGQPIYVKFYHPYGWRTALKDLVRPSKARHVAHISERLAAAGFVVPSVRAVGERRRRGCGRAAWVATAPLDGAPIATVFADPATALASKRAALVAVGTAVARLHGAGFCAGDLVPSNVWIDGRQVAFLDHDRTVEGRWAASWWRVRRNLVQLNRLVLHGVTVTDRLRVYRAYTDTRGWDRETARRRLGWVVRKTIERRQRFDGVPRERATRVSFRELMRAPHEEQVS